LSKSKNRLEKGKGTDRIETWYLEESMGMVGSIGLILGAAARDFF
jgi:hypothetical protein